MNKIAKIFGSTLVMAFAITACSPEKFDGGDQNGIPSISGVGIQVDVDQTTNQATYTATGLPKGSYPLWILDGTTYSTLSKTTYSNKNAGSHTLQLFVGNRNGFSQGSVTGEFTFDKTVVDFKPYINRISREWRINYAEQGHMGCGEPGSDGSNWWSANPEEKKDYGVYEDRLTFTSDGSYTYDPRESGSVYLNKDCTLFPDFNPHDGNDFVALVGSQTSSYSFDVDGEKVVLKLAPNTLFPYISSDAQYANPVFTVSKLTNSEMILLYEDKEITWRFMLTSEAEVAKFKGFNPNYEFNLWKGITPDMTGYYNPDPNWGNEQTGLFESLFVVGDNDYLVSIPQKCYAEWQAQVHFHTNIATNANSHYDFSVILSSDKDIEKAHVKLTSDEDGEEYFFDEVVKLPAGDEVIVWRSDMEGHDFSNVKLVCDFGTADDDTHVNIKNVVLKDHANDDGTVLPSDEPGGDDKQDVFDWDYNSSRNLWKAVDEGSAFDAFGYYFADGSWSPISFTEATKDGDTYEITLPEGLGGSQWQGQFHIDTKLTASAAKTYNFYLLMETTDDCPGVTFKLTDSGDSNFFIEERVDVPAGGFVFKREGVTLKEGTDASAIRLFFDFGGSPAGTTVKISKIYFEESLELNYDDADNLWKAVDEGSAFDSFGYYFADDGWSPVSYTEVTKTGNVYELTLPEGLGGSQWQGQFHIDTKLTASADKEYNFQFDIESDYDLPGVTMKLTDAGDTNWFTEERHDVEGGEVRRFTWLGVKTHEGADASAIRLFFDFGGSPAGAKVKITNIVFEEAK